jgi:hypothetical protein
MMHRRAYRIGWFALPMVLSCFLACTKVSVDLPTTLQTSDPDVSYLETYQVDLATFQLDSFSTGGKSSFVVGNHTDPWFGHVAAESYAQVTPPSTNPVKDLTVFLDSICLRLRPNGLPYGDTTTGLTLNVHEVTEPISTYEGNQGAFYNTQQFTFNPTPLGTKSFTIRPSMDTLISVRLSDALGQDWLERLERNDAEIQSTTAFVDFFRGISLRTDTNTTKALYYLTTAKNGGFIRLYYHANAAIVTQSYIDFGFTTSQQFSHVAYKHDGSALSVFNPNKRELRSTTETGNRAYLDATMGKYVRLTFPTILSLKELHPYVQVIRAQLEIQPTPGTVAYPYSLPPTLNLFQTDNYNNLGGSIKFPGTVAAANGSLFIDQLYGKDTKYTYDITSFIQGIITTGEFASRSLILAPGSYANFDSYKRLVTNDQSLSNGVKLKLYVLGL